MIWGKRIMAQDTAFLPFKISAQHWRVTYKPSTNKQRRSLAGEGEEEAGEGDVRSFPSQKVPRQPTESGAVLRPQQRQFTPTMISTPLPQKGGGRGSTVANSI